MKKTLSILLLISLLLAGFIGCNKTETGAQGTANTEESALQFKVTTVNFGELPTGKKIQAEWLRLCEEKLGRPLDIDFEYIAMSDYGEKLKIILAGGDLSDVTTIFGVKNPDVLKYGEQGVVEELTQYLDSMPNYGKLLTESVDADKIAFSPDGKVYGFYSALYMDDPSGTVATAAAVRKDLLDEQGLSLPTTQDEFYAVAKALKEENPEQYPIIFHEEWMPVESILFAGNHTKADRYFNGTKFVYGPLEDGYKEALMTMNQWYADGLLSPDYFAHTSTEGMASVSNGTASMIANIYPEYPGLWREEFPDQEWVLLPGLENPTHGAPWSTTAPLKGNITLSNGSSLVVSANSKVKADVVKFLDLQYDEEIVNVLTWGIEGTTYEVGADSKKTLLPQFIGGESGDELISLALPASGRCRSGLFPTPQDRNMLWDNLNPQVPILLGNEVIMTQNSRFARENPGAVDPDSNPPMITLTSGESEEYANIMTAVNTYATEWKVKFIKGEVSFDEWERYLEEINSFGDIEKAMEIYNSKL